MVAIAEPKQATRRLTADQIRARFGPRLFECSRKFLGDDAAPYSFYFAFQVGLDCGLKDDFVRFSVSNAKKPPRCIVQKFCKTYVKQRAIPLANAACIHSQRLTEFQNRVALYYFAQGLIAGFILRARYLQTREGVAHVE